MLNMDNRAKNRVEEVLKSSNKYIYLFDNFRLICNFLGGELFEGDLRIEKINFKQLGVFLILAELKESNNDAFSKSLKAQPLANHLSRILKSLKEDADATKFEITEVDNAKLAETKQVIDSDVRSAVHFWKKTLRNRSKVEEVLTSTEQGYKLVCAVERISLEEFEKRTKSYSSDNEVSSNHSFEIRNSEPFSNEVENITDKNSSNYITAALETVTNDTLPAHYAKLQENSGSENIKFIDWIKSRWIIASVFGSLIVLTTVIAFVFYKITNNENSSKFATLVISIAHMIGLLISLLYLLKLKYKKFQTINFLSAFDDSYVYKSTRLKNADEIFQAGKSASDLLANFKICWIILLLGWIPLYLVFSLSAYEFTKSDAPVYAFNVFINLFSYINTLCIGYGFKILHNATVPEDETYSSENFIVYGAISIAGLCLLEFFLPGNEQTALIFKIIGGVTAGIVMALFVGRFQSKFLNLNIFLLIAFYFYIVIQPLVLFIGQSKTTVPPVIEPIILLIAFILKFILILYVFWLIESGRLLFYFVRVRITKSEADDQWVLFQKFLQ